MSQEVTRPALHYPSSTIVLPEEERRIKPPDIQTRDMNTVK